MVKVLFTIFILSLTFLSGISAENKKSIIDSLRDKGLTNIQLVDPGIQVNLKYASSDNFMKTNTYGILTNAYLLPIASEKLKSAQKYLKKINPAYSLLVYDAARPLSVQYFMWELVKGTDKQGYVADPAKHSIHNYGAAVDLTIIDENGVALDMGTPYDFFGDLAQPQFETKFIEQGRLKPNQLTNRLILRLVMTNAGFSMLKNEWWHFDTFSRAYLKSNSYKVID